MTIRTLLVPVDGSTASSQALASALGLAKDLTAHVTALHVRADPRDTVPLLGEGLSANMIEEMMAAAERESDHAAARAHEVFENALRKAGLPSVDPSPAPGEASATWLEDLGRAEGAIAHAGRLSDMMVMPRPDGDGGYGADSILNAALFETGRPVLIAPPDAGPVPGRHVAVAWNGTREAARAVHAALPLLKKADQVTVLTVTDSDEVMPAQDAAELVEYLEWHGIDPKAATVAAEGRSVGQTILAEAHARGCDLLVMGAYTHSRMRELVLGGVTKYMLAHTETALMMAH